MKNIGRSYLCHKQMENFPKKVTCLPEVSEFRFSFWTKSYSFIEDICEGVSLSQSVESVGILENLKDFLKKQKEYRQKICEVTGD